MGADKFPGPVLKTLASALAHQLQLCTQSQQLQEALDAWLRLLTCKKSVEWNQDRVVLYLLGILCRVGFARDPSGCMGMVESFVQLYKVSSTGFMC